MEEKVIRQGEHLIRELVSAGRANAREAIVQVRAAALEERGQGTTEYAILVGVLVVIAIVAIVAFRGKVTELWNAIAEGINSL